MKKDELSWILYDVANSAFVLVIVTVLMPVFFKEYAASGLSGAGSTAIWGYANSFSALVIAAASPVLGIIADYKGNKMRMFVPFLAAGIAFTILLSATGRGEWLFSIIVFIAARSAWSGTLVFYDSFLVDISPRERMDYVSSSGYAWGYIGSVVPFVIIIAMILSAGSGPGVYVFYKAGFVITAIWWLVFSIPMMLYVKQRYFIPASASPARDSFQRLVTGIVELKHRKKILYFLLAYFLYIDGVDTIISMAVAYGIDAGLGTTPLIGAILMIQVLAFPFAILYGKLSEKTGTGFMIKTGIMVYVVITMISFFLPSISSPFMKSAVFFLLAFLVSTSMGGIQALSRSYYGRIIPPERSAEFFGLFNVFGKFAAILGPLMMGIATDLTGNSRYGILCIILLFCAGLFLFNRAERESAEVF